MAYGSYHATVPPFVSADESAITLASTNKALIPSARYANLGTQWFNFIGRKLWIHASGKITTGATPGNLTVAILWGTNADANGVSVVASAATALVANQTNITWSLDVYISARSLGATGTLFGMGEFHANPALIASTAQPVMLPASAAAVSSSVDLTGVLVPSLQALRSGSTAETMTVQDYHITEMS